MIMPKTWAMSVKFSISEKATKIWCNSPKKFCDLLRKPELYWKSAKIWHCTHPLVEKLSINWSPTNYWFSFLFRMIMPKTWAMSCNGSPKMEVEPLTVPPAEVPPQIQGIQTQSGFFQVTNLHTWPQRSKLNK